MTACFRRRAGWRSERERERQAATAGGPAGLRRRRHGRGPAADRATPTTWPRGSGRPLEIVGIAVRRTGKDRSATGVDPALFTTDAEELVTRADVVVEVIGGIEPARSLILRAMEHGAGVVTANKALLAEDGPTLLPGGRRPRRRPLLRGRRRRRHPAAAPAARVAGRRRRAPRARHRQRHHQLRAGQDGLHGRRVHRGASSRRRPWATPRPTRPPTSRASTPPRRPRSWPRWPSTPASAARTSTARASPRSPPPTSPRRARWTAWSSCSPSASAPTPGRPDDGVSVRVHPAMIPRTHPLAGVREAFNAVFVEADAAGQLMFYGPGAGGDPTASAVLGDIVAVARHRVVGGRGPGSPPTPTCRSCRWARQRTRYHISLDVADRPGVLAPGRDGVRRPPASRSRRSASSCLDGDPDESGGDGRASLVVVTHTATDAAPVGHGGRPRGSCRPSAASRPSCASKESDHGPPVARCHRGVPRPAAGPWRAPRW